jgi:hypothetical protein
MDAGADQIVFSRRARAPVRRTGCEQDRVRVVVIAVGRHDVHLVALAPDPRDGERLEHLDTVASRLLHDPIGELPAADTVWEPGVVVETLGDARLTAESLGVDDERGEVLARGVDRGREPGRALRR